VRGGEREGGWEGTREREGSEEIALGIGILGAASLCKKVNICKFAKQICAGNAVCRRAYGGRMRVS
jgi:hypothetical protein